MTRTYKYTAPDGVEQTVKTFLSSNAPTTQIIGVKRAIDGWQPIFNPSYLGGYRTDAVAID